MIKNIIKYPTPLGLEFGTDVRKFDENLLTLISDLKDTIEEYNLIALSAFQIGSYFNVIVYKDENNHFHELVNPVLISHKNEFQSSETTYYYGEIKGTVKRYENISIVYQTKDGENKTQYFDGKLSIILQRKIDYLFGSTFVNKMQKDERKIFDKKLEFGVDVGIDNYCPTTYKKDYISKFINFILVLMILNPIIALFIDNQNIINTLCDIEFYGFFGVILLNFVYLGYSQYEVRQGQSCTSCQTGNIIGTTIISIARVSVITAVSYLFIF